MKNRVITMLAVLLVGSFIAVADDTYCDGYRNGYNAGYCYGERYCLKPLRPLCPLPEIGKRDYMDGYNRGFLDGMAQKQLEN